MTTRIFYAADIHGSEVCWRKFLNAGKFYGAQVLILGGDVVGKAVVPIVLSDASHGTARVQAEPYEFSGEEELSGFEKKVRDSGFYPVRIDPDAMSEFETSDEARRELFERLVRESLAGWLRIADDKHQAGIRVFVMGGNDDPWFVDEILATSETLENGDGEVVRLDEDLDLLSLGYSNITPWHTHRELEEDQLHLRLKEIGAGIEDPRRAIYNVHVPPFDSGLDDAPLLDETLRPVSRLGQIEVGPVGSRAVRETLDEVQPLLGIHGHIHESKGVKKLGATTAVNPGSEYSSGRLHGALIEIRKGAVKGCQLVLG